MLPVEYYHAVFTVPDEISQLAAANKRVLYNILFLAVRAGTAKTAREWSVFQARLGFTSMLHTWVTCPVPAPTMRLQKAHSAKRLFRRFLIYCRLEERAMLHRRDAMIRPGNTRRRRVDAAVITAGRTAVWSEGFGRPGQVVHSDLSVGRSAADGHVGSQSRRAERYSQPLPAHRDQHSGDSSIGGNAFVRRACRPDGDHPHAVPRQQCARGIGLPHTNGANRQHTPCSSKRSQTQRRAVDRIGSVLLSPAAGHTRYGYPSASDWSRRCDLQRYACRLPGTTPTTQWRSARPAK